LETPYFALHGRITVVTAMGAWGACRDERHWYRSLHDGAV